MKGNYNYNILKRTNTAPGSVLST